MSTYLALNHKTLRFAALTGAVLAAACGGGGGGGEASPPPPAPELLQITTQNQAAVARAAAGSFFTLDSVRDFLNASIPTPTQSSTAAELGKRALGKAIAAANAARVWPLAVNSVTQPCPAGGSITATFDDRDNNGKPSSGDVVTLTVNDCRPSPSSLIKGGLGVNLTNYAYPLVSGEFTINQLTISDQPGALTINGQSGFEYTESTDASGARTVRLNLTVGAAGVVGSFSVPTYQDTVTYDPGFRAAFTDVWLPSQSGYDEMALTGKVHIASISGKIMLSTTAPMHDSWVEGEDYPKSGKVDIGGHQSHLVLTATASTTVRLELDYNDDGAIESTRDMAWNELLPF